MERGVRLRHRVNEMTDEMTERASHTCGEGRMARLYSRHRVYRHGHSRLVGKLFSGWIGPRTGMPVFRAVCHGRRQWDRSDQPLAMTDAAKHSSSAVLARSL